MRVASQQAEVPRFFGLKYFSLRTNLVSDSVGNVRGWNGGASTGRSSTWDWRRVLENSPGPWEDGTNRDVWGGNIYSVLMIMILL